MKNALAVAMKTRTLMKRRCWASCGLLLLASICSTSAVAEFATEVLSVESLEECVNVPGNGSAFEAAPCNANATTVAQCCQVEELVYTSSDNQSQIQNVSAGFSPGLACCIDKMCPADTNFTVNDIIECRPDMSGQANVSQANVSQANSSATTYCCRTLCCLQEHKSIMPTLMKRLEDKINHEWLIILSATVAGCGFVAIAFSLFMCHAHRLWSLPQLSKTTKTKEMPEGGTSRSPTISIAPPPMKMFTEQVTKADPGQGHLIGGLRTASTYGSDDEEDQQWLLNSVFNAERSDDPSRRGHSDISVVYQHRIQPKR